MQTVTMSIAEGVHTVWVLTGQKGSTVHFVILMIQEEENT